jgi:hypothetical protein
MRLPQPLLESQFFIFGDLPELIRALGKDVDAQELQDIQRLAELGLPPITSRLVLAAMLGVNPGLIWSFENRTPRHYRTFSIPKGNSTRRIDAPKVALKIAQKWLAVQLQQKFSSDDHVYGFVNNRSHIDAAARHTGAQWIFSLDIKDFFQTTPKHMVVDGFKSLGYGQKASDLLAELTCLRGALAQGAPSSPVLSNICFREFDQQLKLTAKVFEVKLTRYADDIVFSGNAPFPEGLRTELVALFSGWPWQIADQKTKLSTAPDRLKVHGLLVHGNAVRLTKGYRNRLRAYKHLADKNAIREEDKKKILGHLNYGKLVEKKSRSDI